MKLKYTFRNIRLHLVAVLAAIAVAGCADDKIFDEPVPMGGDLVMSFSCNDMLPQYSDPLTTQSRATDPKTEEEKKINSLHLFFFGPDGNFVRPKLDDQSFLPYMCITNATDIVTVKEDVFQTMNNVTVVAVANINATDDAAHNYFRTEWTPDGAIRKDARTTEGTEPYTITCYDDLKQWIYHPRPRRNEGRSISELPSAGMPMIGVAENVSLVKSAGNTRLEVQLRALMARVNISIKLTPDQQSTDGALPTMRILSYGIKNMPMTVPFVAPTAAPTGNGTYSLTGGDKKDDEYELPSPVIINKDSKPVTFSYYTYENIQLPDYAAKRPDGADFFPDGGTTATYPAGIDEDRQKQRWKPVMARTEEASALILKGTYTTHQGINYRAQFTIYMGANPIDDFRVCRNCEYNNNISVHGLDYVRNSSDDVYTFDARVNVVDDNPIYVAIVNERKIDAHATALPMDIWLMPREPQNGVTPTVDFTTKVTLEIDEKDKDWISMMLVPRKEMEDAGFAAGTGIVKYFYTDLVQACNAANTYTDPATGVKRECGRKIDITCLPSTDPNYVNESRSRIYFYIDENVPTPETVNNNTYGDRMAHVKLTYETTSTSGAVLSHYERTIEIEQRALVHVNGVHTTSGNQIDTWMEYYEEYLEHNDPLDKHEEEVSLYSGLPWGESLYGVAVRGVVPGIDGDVVYLTDDAFRYTKGILTRNGAVPLTEFTLHSKPVTAFHYCYGRNKRNGDSSQGEIGTVLTLNKTERYGLFNRRPTLESGWYMPGIRELEVAMVNFYLDFKDFANPENLYLSAACGKKDGTGRNAENVNTARATIVKDISNGNVQYEGSTNALPGAVDRREPWRIRAFYRMDK